MYNISVSADSTSHFIMVSTIAPDITIGMAYIFGRQNFALQLKSLHYAVGGEEVILKKIDLGYLLLWSS